jgi:hypothetical protein
MKARLAIAMEINTIGVFLKLRGMLLLYSIFSLNAENNTNTIPNPRPELNPKIEASNNESCSLKDNNATPKTAQFDVINGRKTPNDLNNNGEVIFINISTP